MSSEIYWQERALSAERMLNASPVQQSPAPRGTNEYGLDIGYLAEKLNLLLRDISRHTPSEAARVLARLASVADENVLSEPEFSQKIISEDWTSSGKEYDRAIHHNPDAKAWADLFIDVFPRLADKHEIMHGWFANAMMAMHDWLKSKESNKAEQAINTVSNSLPPKNGNGIPELVGNQKLSDSTLKIFEQPDSADPIQHTPSDAQLEQIFNGIGERFVSESCREFLRVWIRDWTMHKLEKLQSIGVSNLSRQTVCVELPKPTECCGTSRHYWPVPLREHLESQGYQVRVKGE